jgi:hypothetical protein
MEEGITFRYPMGPTDRRRDPEGTGRQTRSATSLWNPNNVMEEARRFNTRDGEAAIFDDLPG